VVQDLGALGEADPEEVVVVEEVVAEAEGVVVVFAASIRHSHMEPCSIREATERSMRRASL
jgi:hypothetical protein